jgi:hypothetical protein
MWAAVAEAGEPRGESRPSDLGPTASTLLLRHIQSLGHLKQQDRHLPLIATAYNRAT